MSIKQIDFAAVKDGQQVTLKLREGESVIVGTASHTERGNVRVTLTNNRNSVVLKPGTNFRIFADVPPTAAEFLAGLPVGATFDYKNKYGKTKSWVKSGENRFTRVGGDLPAVSYTVKGFPSEDLSVVTNVDEPYGDTYDAIEDLD